MIGRSLAIAIDPSPALHDALGWPPLVWAVRVGVMAALLAAAFLVVRIVSTRVPRPHPPADPPPVPPARLADRRPADRRVEMDEDAALKAATELAEASRQIEALLARLTRIAVPHDPSADDRDTRRK